MDKKPRILIIGAQHGNERLGPRLKRYITRYPERYETVEYLCGNPRAFRANIRFMEADLNRSYDPVGRPSTYEEKRAQKILRYIREGNYDYVFDVHTSYTDVDRFFLATSAEGPISDIVAASTIQRLVVMPSHIADCSLIGQVPQAISIEYNRDLAVTGAALRELVTLLDNLLVGRRLDLARDIFPVREKIPMHIELQPRTPNFRMSRHGFYPVLIGPNTYVGYKGFAAYYKETAIM
jgi:hypothetical protein